MLRAISSAGIRRGSGTFSVMSTCGPGSTSFSPSPALSLRAVSCPGCSPARAGSARRVGKWAPSGSLARSGFCPPRGCGWALYCLVPGCSTGWAHSAACIPTSWHAGRRVSGGQFSFCRCVRQPSYGASFAYWSLSLIEQFYPVVPLVALLLRRHVAWLLLILVFVQAGRLQPEFSEWTLQLYQTVHGLDRPALVCDLSHPCAGILFIRECCISGTPPQGGPMPSPVFATVAALPFASLAECNFRMVERPLRRFGSIWLFVSPNLLMNRQSAIQPVRCTV
jgi:hypothetical protein